ncbi:uncharacterized protein GGS22DRAFT_197360 [Annulohypoxylon maeteangense]|uniref:uncharacterized protein n=1 Tax=Annulohypoxylon maeteangense TaxID=1927788 RepID=UPI0020083D97|nr:uncharacterized protein GGS22DRAFT_197360 [Annulohypoxylon maeteangense]KAI0880791.1 hypothetical protein GGS22DRAFT_197360 [Annulohypoxylon maeteangense]
MDFLDELESMAQVAVQQPFESNEPGNDDISRWQSLFGYTYSQAAQKIQEHRSDLSRVLVTESHWEIVRAEKEAQGYNKEAYEHSCTLTTCITPTPQKRSTRATKPSIYLLKLEGPLSNVTQVKSAAGSLETPPELRGTDDSGEPTTFCKINSEDKEKILDYLSRQGSRFQPTFVRYSKAEKDLSVVSAYPSLGIDTTMPQHRPVSTEDLKLCPAPNQFPVWYFFYGTLADPAVIKRLLGCEPSYRPASLTRGALKTWGGKYKALVDAFDDRAEVQGHAFLVQSQEEEDSLQLYETDKYDVVRCEIHMDDQRIRGLTFRFIGDVDL